MTFRRLLATLAPALLLALAAAPAQATLLVRSDGAGLFVQDKNGLDDRFSVEPKTRDGQTIYIIHNTNPFDAFPFDRQTGCSPDPTLTRSSNCDRNGSVANFVTGSGNDRIFAGFAPLGTFGANLGSGNDEYTGQNSTDNVDGFGGNDLFEGRGGNDDFDGGDGEDRVVGEGGNDNLSGDGNDDRIGGDSGNDIVAGGGGADFLVGDLGVDSVSGGDGNDSLRVREPEGTTAQADTANCGNGTDFVEADLKDIISSSCNTRDVSAVNETPLVRIGRGTLRVRSSGRVRVRLRCPGGVGSLGCKGRLSLRLDLRGARRARRRYEIRAGRRKTVTVRLSRGSVRSLRRRQRRGRRTRGVLASVERGRLGRKTTVRNRRLRLW
jgi:Ca2+-binding RTX toxin-like protein